MALPISASTALVGVLGDPVRHSLSPAMHNAALAALGLDWIYLALPTPAGELAAVVHALEALDCRGLNVTLPHKEAVAACCAELSPLAARVGAVNTLVRRQAGGWLGTNTDVEGFLAPLRREGHAWQGSRAVVLGCGGSARAVVAGLVELGCGAIAVAGRQAANLERFAAGCRAWAPQLSLHAWHRLGELLPGCQLLVNTTPVGMASPTDPAAARACPLDEAGLAALTPQAWVYDLIYTPRPSQLLRRAAGRGCRTLDGLEMLVQQGAASLRLWSGTAAVPVEAMREAAERHLAAA
ncbi:shikimate 5-dehydrogenase [Cyanobium sp. PCC 7001]|uniref:shikimate dehydrogenase n=1 Tax=Cyanobium sp. PCC 7001 TaxID=180281 RepID=UPI0001805D5C|nr:shikimate dehydrogenase [Cyanobium sp. PCC 7001]EDY39184.1 shikimate 5-dehydrogenase [Cyanobium sp. PCC 7001]